MASKKNKAKQNTKAKQKASSKQKNRAKLKKTKDKQPRFTQDSKYYDLSSSYLEEHFPKIEYEMVKNPKISEPGFINLSVESNGVKRYSQIKLGLDKSEEQDIKDQIDEYFSSITRYDDLEDLLINADEDDYQSEVINTMIERHLTIEEAMEICGVSYKDIKRWLFIHSLVGLTPDMAFRRLAMEASVLSAQIETRASIEGDRFQLTDKLVNELTIKTMFDVGKMVSHLTPYAFERDFSYETQVEERGSSETPKIDHIPPYKAFRYARERWGMKEFQFNPETPYVDFAELRRFKKYPVAAWNDEPEKIRYFHHKTGFIFWIYADQEASFLNPEPEVNNKTRAKTTAKATAKKATKTTAKTTAKTTKSTAKSNTKSEAKSSTGSTAKKATTSTSKSSSKSSSKSTSKSVVKLVKITPKTPSEPKTKSSTKSETKSATKSSTKPTTKSSTKSATKSTTKSTAKSTAKSTTKNSAKLVAKSSTKSATKSSTKSATKSSTKSATNSSTKSETKSTTKPTTKSTSKSAAKSTAKSTTKSTTKSSTKKISGLKIY